MTDKIKWEKPPARSVRHREGKYDFFFDALRSKPGEWARFPGKTTTSAATSINNGKYANTEKHEFEATFRTLEDGSQGIWVRLREAEAKIEVAGKPLPAKAKKKAS